MVEYEVYFPKNFDFVMGGKLPGMHGGNLQCSGYSSIPNGNNCFSTRLMWRENGEVRSLADVLMAFGFRICVVPRHV
jgi:hypothetical protein